MSGLIRRTGWARPWPEGEPRRKGERCELSDLLITECACKKHRGDKKGEEDGDGNAQIEELDFR